MRDQMATTDAAQQTDNAMTFDNPAQAFGQASKARAEALARNDTGLADEWQATMVAAQKAVDAEQVEMGLPKPPPMGVGMSEGDLNSMELGSTILVKGDVWEQIGVGRWQGKANGTELSSGQLAKGIPFNPDFYPKSPQSPGTGKTMTTAQAERELADLRKKNFFGSVLLGKRISQLEDMLHQSKEGGPDPMSAEDALHQEMEGGPQSPGTSGIQDKPIYGLADEIRADWKNVNFAAAPYLDAMNSLDSIDDHYFQDNGRVASLLARRNLWRDDYFDRSARWRYRTARVNLPYGECWRRSIVR